jgi:hypothetical protein
MVQSDGDRQTDLLTGRLERRLDLRAQVPPFAICVNQRRPQKLKNERQTQGY